jgi:hypothetical protein
VTTNQYNSHSQANNSPSEAWASPLVVFAVPVPFKAAHRNGECWRMKKLREFSVDSLKLIRCLFYHL